MDRPSDIEGGRLAVAPTDGGPLSDGRERTSGRLKPPGALVWLALGLCTTTLMAWRGMLSRGEPRLIIRPVDILGGGDSYPFWFALRALRQGDDPYGPATTQVIHEALWGPADHSTLLHFVYPLPALLWYLPGLWLDLSWFVVFVRMLALVATVGTIWLTARLVGQPLVGWSWLALGGVLLSLPAVHDQYVLGQNASLSVLVGLAIAGLYGGQRFLLAGLLLPLVAIKPHYLLLLLLGLAIHAAVARRRWPFLAGGLVSSLSVLIGCQAVAPGWFERWLANLARNSAAYQDTYLSLIAGADPLTRGLVGLGLVGLVVPLWWRGRARPLRGPWAALAVTGSLAVGTIIFSPTYSTYNLLPIWPALALAMLSPAYPPLGQLGRLVLALARLLAMGPPLLAGLVVLAGLVAPTEWRLALVTAYIAGVIGSLWLGPLLIVWLAEQTLPAAVRAWEPVRRRAGQSGQDPSNRMLSGSS